MSERELTPDLASGYPPERHMLRDMALSVLFQGKERAIVRAPVVPELTSDQGTVPVGLMATMVDVLGGALAIMAVYPDWTATADLVMHTTGRARSGTVIGDGSVLRIGRTTAVIEVELYEQSGDCGQPGRPLGSALMTFARLLRREDTLELELDDYSNESFGFANEGSGFTRPYLDECGVRVIDEATGQLSVDMCDYLRNSFGAFQGGMLAVLGDVAGQHAARAATGKPLMTSDLAVHFLSPAKIGPFRTRAEVLRTTGDTALTRVEVFDGGDDDRLATVVMNTATLDGAR